MHHRTYWGRAIFQLLLLLGLTGLCLAQGVTGNIAGTVTDPSGAVVPNATVTIKSLEQNTVLRTLSTDSDGNYSATLLPVGHYTITVTAPGFRAASQENIPLNVHDKRTANFQLEVGPETQALTVQAAPVQVQSQTAEAAGLVSGTQVRELSINNRNYEQLVTLMPGVSSGASDQLYIGTTNPLGGTNVVSFSINGQRNSANNWMVDGADNVDRGANLTLLTYPSVDAIAEFKVLRGMYSSEYGRSAAGQINVVTRSGASTFHGDAYEFFRNDVLSANYFFNNASGIPRKPLRYNNFGYTIGGPIFIPHVYNKDRNKTFFFFSEEFRRVINYGTVQGTVATPSEIQGNFPSPVCVASSGGTCIQTATSITNINPVSAAYIKDIFSRLPATPANNLIFTPLRSIFNHRQELIRIDHHFSDRFTVFGRYLHDSIPTEEPGGLFTGSALPGVATTSTNSPGRSVVLHATMIFTPTLLNELGYAYSYGAIISRPTGLISPALSPDVKVNLPFPSTLARIPALTITGGSGVAGFGPYNDYNRNHQIFDNATKSWGAHTLRFGASVYFYQKTENSGTNAPGTFTFSATPRPDGTTAFQQAWANFLLGNVSTFTQNSTDLTPDVRARQFEAYLQDDIRVSTRLTLNLGVRYSLFPRPYDARKMLTNFDTARYDPAKAPQIDVATGNTVPGTGDPLNGIIVNGNVDPAHASPFRQESGGYQQDELRPARRLLMGSVRAGPHGGPQRLRRVLRFAAVRHR